jgi:hypothetical protein
MRCMNLVDLCMRPDILSQLHTFHRTFAKLSQRRCASLSFQHVLPSSARLAGIILHKYYRVQNGPRLNETLPLGLDASKKHKPVLLHHFWCISSARHSLQIAVKKYYFLIRFGILCTKLCLAANLKIWFKKNFVHSSIIYKSLIFNVKILAFDFSILLKPAWNKVIYAVKMGLSPMLSTGFVDSSKNAYESGS